MKLGQVDFGQPSSIRGAVWVVTAIVAVIAYWIGKDPMPVLLIGTSVAGGLGVGIREEAKDIGASKVVANDK
jgi:hypothetical protein